MATITDVINDAVKTLQDATAVGNTTTVAALLAANDPATEALNAQSAVLQAKIAAALTDANTTVTDAQTTVTAAQKVVTDLS